MCLINLKTKKEVEEYKKKQPDEFVVWKVVQTNGNPEYNFDDENEPNLDQSNETYKARYFPIDRMPLKYKPGFHAFRTKQQAQFYLGHIFSRFCKKLKRFEAKREWITNIGKINNVTCLVLSHIKTENK